MPETETPIMDAYLFRDRPRSDPHSIHLIITVWWSRCMEGGAGVLQFRGGCRGIAYRMTNPESTLPENWSPETCP